MGNLLTQWNQRPEHTLLILPLNKQTKIVHRHNHATTTTKKRKAVKKNKSNLTVKINKKELKWKCQQTKKVIYVTTPTKSNTNKENM